MHRWAMCQALSHWFYEGTLNTPSPVEMAGTVNRPCPILIGRPVRFARCHGEGLIALALLFAASADLGLAHGSLVRLRVKSPVSSPNYTHYRPAARTDQGDQSDVVVTIRKWMGQRRRRIQHAAGDT